MGTEIRSQKRNQELHRKCGGLSHFLGPDSGPIFGTGFWSQFWERIPAQKCDHRIPDSCIDALRALAGELLLTSASPISGCGNTDQGFRFPVTEIWVRTVDSEFWLPASGLRIPDAGCRNPESGVLIVDPGLRNPAPYSRFPIPDSGFRIPDTGFRSPDSQHCEP